MAEIQQVLHASSNKKYDRPLWAENRMPPPPDLPGITQRAIDIYLLSKQPSGEMGGIGWWQCANGYTAIALHDLSSPDARNYDVLATALKSCERVNGNNFINEFNDDSLWWALCCVHVFTIRGDAWFLEKARAVWQHIVRSGSVVRRGQLSFHGQDMEGAVYWTTKRGEEQLNAISTGLFAELSVRLALLDHGNAPSSEPPRKHHHLLQKLLPGAGSSSAPPTREELLGHAQRALGWIWRCRFRPEEGIALDNILIQKQVAQDWTFTYNTGVAIGAAALFFEATGEVPYVIMACRMAQAAMRKSDWVESIPGTLTEPGPYGKGNHEPHDNSDAVGFKAVLIRQLGTLYTVIRRLNVNEPEAQECATLIKQFVNVNIHSQQERNTNGNGQYGPWWNGPFEMPTSHSQMAVLDVMAAAVVVNSA